jgi:hypothetical protein
VKSRTRENGKLLEQGLTAASAILLRRQQAGEIAKIQRPRPVAGDRITMGKTIAR